MSAPQSSPRNPALRAFQIRETARWLDDLLMSALRAGCESMAQYVRLAVAHQQQADREDSDLARREGVGLAEYRARHGSEGCRDKREAARLRSKSDDGSTLAGVAGAQ
jgi:hypothetical protein